jgi:rod shape-determining protein MreD
LALLVVTAILQSALAPHLAISHIHPELMVLVILTWSLLKDQDEALVWAFVGGIILDLLSGLPFGVSSLSLVLVCLAAGVWHGKSFGNPYLMPVLLALPYTILSNLIVLLYMQLSGYAIAWGSTFVRIVFPAGLINMAAMAVIYPALLRLERLLTKDDLTI